MKYIKIVSFIIMLSLLVFANKIFGQDKLDSGVPINFISIDEPVVIIGKVRKFKRHRRHISAKEKWIWKR